jgi:hypothetical protein
MGRKLLADSELRGANLSVRVPAGLNEALERAVAGRACTKSDLVIAALGSSRCERLDSGARRAGGGREGSNAVGP